MKVLVIGGTGLISTAIVKQLVERGDAVTIYNRGRTPKRIPGGVEVLTGDRSQYARFEEQLQGQNRRFDAVIDMMAFQPEDARSLLRAVRGRARQIVVCSTTCVYGGPMTRLPADDAEPHRPVTDYGRQKSEIEAILLNADGQDGLRTTVLRPSFTTGEGATASGVLFDDTTVERIRQGRPVIVHGDGRTRWAVAHVSDVARGFVNALENPKAFGQAYHLTSHEHTDWDGVFAALGEAAGRAPELVHLPTEWLSGVAPRRSVGVKYIYQYDSIYDNSKAERDLGFRTTVSTVETFRRQIRWMEESGKVQPIEQDQFEDVMIDCHAKGRIPSPEGWLDFNPWHNQTTN
jgi:nucleoside-diphosphate-sugar epimerase